MKKRDQIGISLNKGLICPFIPSAESNMERSFHANGMKKKENALKNLSNKPNRRDPYIDLLLEILGSLDTLNDMQKIAKLSFDTKNMSLLTQNFIKYAEARNYNLFYSSNKYFVFPLLGVRISKKNLRLSTGNTSKLSTPKNTKLISRKWASIGKSANYGMLALTSHDAGQYLIKTMLSNYDGNDHSKDGFDLVFRLIGFLGPLGAGYSITYTLIDEFYPGGIKGYIKDIYSFGRNFTDDFPQFLKFIVDKISNKLSAAGQIELNSQRIRP